MINIQVREPNTLSHDESNVFTTIRYQGYNRNSHVNKALISHVINPLEMKDFDVKFHTEI